MQVETPCRVLLWTSHIISYFEIYSLVRSLDIVSSGCHNMKMVNSIFLFSYTFTLSFILELWLV